MKKALVVGMLVGVVGMAGTATASDPITVPVVSDATQAEGCASQGPNDTCTYTATRSGGYVAAGSTWTLKVDADGAGPGAAVTYTPANAPEMGCGLWGPGAVVTISNGAQAAIAAGNPFPVQSDPVVSNNNDC